MKARPRWPRPEREPVPWGLCILSWLIGFACGVLALAQVAEFMVVKP